MQSQQKTIWSKTSLNSDKVLLDSGKREYLSKLKLDLHPIYNKGELIDKALVNSFAEAEKNKIDEIEIIFGKGSGQLKKRVLRFLDQKDVRLKYHRVKKDVKNSGRAFVYFRW